MKVSELIAIVVAIVCAWISGAASTDSRMTVALHGAVVFACVAILSGVIAWWL